MRKLNYSKNINVLRVVSCWCVFDGLLLSKADDEPTSIQIKSWYALSFGKRRHEWRLFKTECGWYMSTVQRENFTFYYFGFSLLNQT